MTTWAILLALLPWAGFGMRALYAALKTTTLREIEVYLWFLSAATCTGVGIGLVLGYYLARVV